MQGKGNPNIRRKEGLYDEYPEENFKLGLSIPKEGCEYFLVDKLYRDEAVIISQALQNEKIFHYVGKDKDDSKRYEVYVAYENALDHDRLERFVFALQDIISNLLRRYVVWEIGTVNILIFSKNGFLNKIVTTGDNLKDYEQVVKLLVEYLRNILSQ